MARTIEEVINTMYEMVQDAWSVPLSSDKCVLEREKVLDLLDEMNNSLPGEFKQAKTIVDARNEIIGAAKREAEALVKQAELKAKQMTSEQEICRKAEEEADRIIADANSQAAKAIEAANKRLSDLKDASLRFVVDALSETEAAISASMKKVASTRSKLDGMVAPKEEKSVELPELDEQPEKTEELPETAE